MGRPTPLAATPKLDVAHEMHATGNTGIPFLVNAGFKRRSPLKLDEAAENIACLCEYAIFSARHTADHDIACWPCSASRQDFEHDYRCSLAFWRDAVSKNVASVPSRRIFSPVIYYRRPAMI